MLWKTFVQLASQNPFVTEKRWGIGLQWSSEMKNKREKIAVQAARMERTSKDIVDRGSPNAIKTFLLPLVNLSLLLAWRFGTSFCYEASLIWFAFLTPVRKSSAVTTRTIEYSVKNKLNLKSIPLSTPRLYRIVWITMI